MSNENTVEAYAKQIFESLADESIIRFWTETELLAQLRQRNKGRQKQVIHDIPRAPLADLTPYDLAHRILKDIYFKAAALMGFNVAYAPAWNLFDPAVEADVAQSEHQAGRIANAVKIRRRCKSRVGKRMQREKHLLQRLGIFADWRGIRPHLEPRYEARLLDAFGVLMERGFLTKESKASYWCVECQTILTEDELQFKPRKSAAAYVRFPVRKGLERLGADVSFMVWVVELWALPAGIAVALPKTGRYVAIQHQGHTLIIEEETARKVLGKADYPVRETLGAAELLECTCSHPLLNVELRVVQSEINGNTRKGTGLFLAVPGHDQDDYAVRLEHNYKIVSIIDDEGRLTEDAEAFCGLSVFDASEHIALQLDNMGFLMQTDMIEAPYPHCWTCESPAVFRPADQWLFDPQRNRLSSRALQALDSVERYSNETCGHVMKRIEAQCKWGASRQRVWGLPVPAFYCQKCGAQLEVERAVKAVRDFISHKGTDAWFGSKADDILSNDVTCTQCGEREFRKDTSILDSRMITLLATLLQMEGRRETAAIGDVYIEQCDDAQDWIAQMLTALYAMKEHFPTQFLHVVDAREELPARALLTRPSLMRILDESAAGSDELRLLMFLSDAPPDESDERLVDRVRTEYEAFKATFAHIAFIARGSSRLAKLPSQMPASFALFGVHLAEMSQKVVGAYRRYAFTEAWASLRALRADVHDFARFAEGLIRTESRPGRLKALLGEWGVRFLKLVTPFVPVLGEHLWREAFGAPEGASIFLSDWPFPVDESGTGGRKALAGPPIEGCFAEWVTIIRAVRDAAATSQTEGPAILVVDVPEYRAAFDHAESGLRAFVAAPVRIVAGTDVEEADEEPIEEGARCVVRVSHVLNVAEEEPE